jgi:hypothetical protein
MKKSFAAIAVVLLTQFTTSAAQAGCSCECVGGSVRAVCSSSLDIRPICPANVCLTPIPEIRPIQPLMTPPVGATSCQEQQVYNSNSGRYEWRRLCR